jgi:hypothetical protein
MTYLVCCDSGGLLDVYPMNQTTEVLAHEARLRNSHLEALGYDDQANWFVLKSLDYLNPNMIFKIHPVDKLKLNGANAS